MEILPWQGCKNVTKSVRRKAKVDEEYLAKLFDDTTSLYRLDGQSGAIGKANLGPLPLTAKLLLWALALTWAGIIAYLVKSYIKEHKK